MLVGGALGAAAITGLHAQTKPPVYPVSEIEVTNPAALRSRIRTASSGRYQSGCSRH